MYDREVTLPLTEDEWRALCEVAKSRNRTPKLQARYMLRAALEVEQKSTQPQATAQTAEINRLLDRLDYLEWLVHRYVNDAGGDGR